MAGLLLLFSSSLLLIDSISKRDSDADDSIIARGEDRVRSIVTLKYFFDERLQ